MLAGRSYFQGISRLLPGQALSYDPVTDHLAISETPDVWSDLDGYAAMTPADYADAYWERLRVVAKRALKVGKATLMVSGGWDSRTLLAAFRDAGPSSLLCYTHGDLESREIALATRLSTLAGASLITRPLDSSPMNSRSWIHSFRESRPSRFRTGWRPGRLWGAMGLRQSPQECTERSSGGTTVESRSGKVPRR